MIVKERESVARPVGSREPRLEPGGGLGGGPARELVLSSSDVEARPWRPFEGDHGARDKVLWEEPATGSFAGLMELAPGASVRAHFHRAAVHHLYVIRGSCELSISERVIGPGAYTFVPPETQHGIDRAGPQGCTFFFVSLLPGGEGRAVPLVSGSDA